MANGIYGHYLDNKAWDATVTANQTPLSGYANSTLVSLNPAARLRYNTGTVTITLTFGSAVTADTFALPVSNLAGSVLTLTNGAGLSQAITLPTIPDNRIPLTAVKSFSSSSSTTWNLVISGNAANVILGGGLWLGAKRTLDRNFRYEFHEIGEQPGPEVTNEYGVDYTPNLRTLVRRLQCEFAATATGRAQLKAWFEDGRKRPCFFWPDPSVNDAYIGKWATTYDVTRGVNVSTLSMEFAELSKGKPV